METKEQLRERIIKDCNDPMAVLFWFDTLYHRHEKNREFTHDQIYAMLVPVPNKELVDDSSRAFMDALTASDDAHYERLRRSSS